MKVSGDRLVKVESIKLTAKEFNAITYVILTSELSL